MRAINHSLTGALIGLTITQPAIAVPLALASHFVLDMIPHHGVEKGQNKWIASNEFRYLLYIDALLCVGLVVALFTYQPVNWVLAAVCAFAAASPDLVSFDRYRHIISNKKYKPNLYNKFASGIQWFERPIGVIVEIVWIFAALAILVPIIS